jgi:hypothetical protein
VQSHRTAVQVSVIMIISFLELASSHDGANPLRPAGDFLLIT